MSIDIPHPDRLAPGDFVGPWKLLEVLGAGGLGRVFKVESEGKVYALKMAVRLPGEKLPGEEDVDGWCMREATAMMGRSPHPNIPRVFQVGRWPNPESGFLFVVMEYVDGLSFTDWRYETHPSAAQLVDVMLPLVRTLADLHKAGIQHRDLNAQNVLIRRDDGRPVLLDFGSASLPGARTLTQGIPPVNLSVVPPEAFEHARLNGEDARFRGGPSADLYALGVLMYQALADGYPFNPELSPERLLAAITLRMPRAPHRVNPKAPKSLSAISMRLLAKRPEDRFDSAETLYKSLWEANKERTSREWKVPLGLPESGPAPVTDEEMQERKRDDERTRLTVEAREAEEDAASAKKDSTDAPPSEEVFARMNTVPVRHTKTLWTWARVRRPVLGMTTAFALVAGLVVLASWWSTNRPDALPSMAPHASTRPVQPGLGQEVAPPWMPPEANAVAASPEAAFTPTTLASPAMLSEDSAPVKTPTTLPSTPLRAARKAVGVATTCTLLTGCPGAQVRPDPPPEACPEGAVEAMEKWNITPGEEHVGVFVRRVNPHYMEVSEGPTTVYISGGQFKDMPGAAALSGRLIFGARVFGRLTQAKTPDGKTFPVCFELEDEEGGRGLIREADGGPGTAKVFSSVTVRAVRKFQ
ncbi:serine/threonine protein kinase [Pyxidicoccus xibeiensis]|uniref:serine/threonine protein kinase n=1 Tax=Pyxidicoccus xibeiensis TaxID=2906759 RepID=UPI0020A826D5|nr:serine/threonine protein kinase [Pyxidicoccus xibeiensis]MCP3139253.1 protein kinase [Pyxidicoccus xibeiensis]